MKVSIGPYTFDKNKKRDISIEIENYDVWDMHDTLSLIVYPMLKKIRETKCFYPKIDDLDLPDDIKTFDLKTQWKWLIDEIMWAVEQRTLDDYGEDQFWIDDINDYDYKRLYDHRSRIKNGFILFGKYFLTLGD